MHDGGLGGVLREYGHPSPLRARAEQTVGAPMDRVCHLGLAEATVADSGSGVDRHGVASLAILSTNLPINIILVKASGLYNPRRERSCRGR